MKCRLECDANFPNTFHSPGIESWITGFLRGRRYDSALDIGCGLGLMAFFLKIFLDNVNYLVGLDISRDKVFKAKKTRLYDDLIVADARSLPFRGNSFDLALSIGISAYFNLEEVLRGGREYRA
ncbi:MAG: class I SAM-dependent methyltransferase [Candidatus Nezhaarchaeota archaeon]|nr:class I SAM-dependent methyltransferase [Candidatus Nezhaarchaeota archaeon]